MTTSVSIRKLRLTRAESGGQGVGVGCKPLVASPHLSWAATILRVDASIVDGLLYGLCCNDLKIGHTIYTDTPLNQTVSGMRLALFCRASTHVQNGLLAEGNRHTINGNIFARACEVRFRRNCLGHG